jgi:glycosyltransferase involved in cell wall biosynthesis
MISVITITYNNYTELVETLDSLKNISDIESIVVNGGSCKRTLEFLKTYPGKSVSEKDAGISDAFNKGLKLASGDAILFLNSGDKLIEPSYLEYAVRILAKNRDIDFIYADIILNDPIAGPLLLKSVNKLPSMPFNHPTLIIRRQVVDKVGEFKLEYKIGMDLDFVYRMLKITTSGHYVQQIVVLMDGNGISSSKHYMMLKEKFKIVIDNKDFSMRALFILSRHFFFLIIKKILQSMYLGSLITKIRKKKNGYKDSKGNLPHTN